MDAERVDRVMDAYTSFFAGASDQESVLDLFHRVAATVPAYRKFLAEHHIKPGEIATMEDFRRLPLMDKKTYHRRYPLPERCRGGRLDGCDMVAVSSGSSGQPTMWPRSLIDELEIARRFEQVFRGGFQAHERTTLAVVCFPRAPGSVACSPHRCRS